MRPQMMIMRMGLALKRLVDTKAKRNSRQLMMNWYLSVTALPKFSSFINSRAAAANKPITAGRKPLNTDSTNG